MGKIYSVYYNNGKVDVKNNKTGALKSHNFPEFVYGQYDYNDATEKYPNYVHARVWEVYEMYNRVNVNDIVREEIN